MNFKGQLQEICQKKSLPLPRYETFAVENKWGAIAYVFGKEFIGETFSTKKVAEADAARMALENIPDDKNTFDPDKIPWKLVMIDLENRPCFFEPPPGNLYLGFIGEDHVSLKKYKDWYLGFSTDLNRVVTEVAPHSNKILYTIDGKIKDTIDHFMSAMILPVINFLLKTRVEIPEVVIVTGDHSGHCTKVLFDKFLETVATTIKVTVVSSLS